MPWIPIVPAQVKKSACSNQGVVGYPNNGNSPQCSEKDSDLVTEKNKVLRQSVSKKFSVTISQRNVSAMFLIYF
jgi:hypothetical protein